MTPETPKSVSRKSWYDGWIYATFIDQEQNPVRDKVIDLLTPGSRILDVGCATGKFAIKLAKNGFRVTGIDISDDMISMARKNQALAGLENLVFINTNASYAGEHIREMFDYALFSFSIHEIPHHERLELIEAIKPLSRNIVFCDYQTPPPSSFFGIGVWSIEFLAGMAHFNNFRDFVDRGGLTTLCEDSGLKITEDVLNPSGIFRIVISEHGDKSEG
jgi:SAM-dependent methyltransferase